MTVNITSLKAIYNWACKNQYHINNDIYYTNRALEPIRARPHFNDIINFYYILHTPSVSSSLSYNATEWLKNKYPDEYLKARESSSLSFSSTQAELKKLVARFQYDNDLLLEYITPQRSRYDTSSYSGYKVIPDFKRANTTVVYDFLNTEDFIKIGIVKEHIYLFRKDVAPSHYSTYQLLLLGCTYPSERGLVHIIKTYYRSLNRSSREFFKNQLIDIYKKLEHDYQKEKCLSLSIEVFEPGILKKAHAPLKDVIASANTFNMSLLDILNNMKLKHPKATKVELPTFDF